MERRSELARHVVLYVTAHQPRRLKLPAEPIPADASPQDIECCLFDENLDRHYFQKTASSCYHPTTTLFRRLVQEGLRLSIGFSFSLLRQAEIWEPELLARFQELVAHPNVELVCEEPYHSFLPLIDLPRFSKRMRWAQQNLDRIFGRKPRITDTTEMLMSDAIYWALEKAGFHGALMDGRPMVLEWRQPGYVYHGGGDLMLLARHHRLSDDVGYRFSDRGESGWPLAADTYARWIAETPGDLVFLGWDYETFGELHSRETGIFEFLAHLPEELTKHGVISLTPSRALELYGGQAHHLPLPALGCTWAGGGGLGFFLGNPCQQTLFRLMLSAYNKALLTGNARLIDLALWLMQSDNLHAVQWTGGWGPEAEISAGYTPEEWWQRLGSEGIPREMRQVYVNFHGALDYWAQVAAPGAS